MISEADVRVLAMEALKPIHPIDIQVGQRVRARRKVLGLSQGELAAAVAVTFQQIQKYENAKNRISASKLYEIARELRAPIEHFFSSPADEATHPQSAPGEIGELLSAFMKIDHEDLRQSVLTLVKSLAEPRAAPSKSA